MTAFRLAHLSDLQLPPPPLPFRWRDAASKRLLSRFAWRRKQHRHIQAVLDAIAADVAAHAPDHVAITGDVINFATPEEFAAARAWLEGLGDPANVTVSPGNHDALSAAGAPKSFAPWRPWLGDEGEGFPYLRVRGPVALINLSSAIPTALHLAQGTLGAAQIERLRAVLRETGQRGLYRIVLLHHPVAVGVVAGRKELTDAEALRAVLREVGAELVLHGHAHEALMTSTPGPNGAIPILAVPAASTPFGGHGQPARWNEIAVARDGADFRTRVTAHGITGTLSVEPLGSYVLC
ncbi:MAG: metallophosphoesterase [Alphaproteobacteria bacterium]|nr:metallophosphoesterase [Alphaproteobacteria bacterium]MBU1516942.1 metallophosphoesterase [Alphaproteobacteria bacterium]MBU2095830.1 metallophosphoesterase [Alphaproteobacteria bacterium]MBU2152033.1 metallophosphoesterase [Alphaproteobacteria bacterium]MBU2309554.1 metallophosphoesterase [Alphaproteobacteria bacterium]